MPAKHFTPYRDDNDDASRIERELLTLYAHISAANYRFLCLLNDYDDLNAWHGTGIKSFAHWLNWRCGIGLTAAREKIRVARALKALPGIASAFSEGTLSYSKVRALTRVATPDNEASLLSIARCGTAAHVERICQGLRRCQSLKEARVAHQRRALSYYRDDDGCLVIRGRLPAECAERVLAALDTATERLREERREQSGADSDAADMPFAACRADALGRLAESYLAHGDQALSGGERTSLVVHVNPQALRENASAEASAPKALTARGAPLSRETVKRLSCDASLLAVYENAEGEPLAIGRKTRTIPPAINRALALRDGGCRFPGCTERRFVDAHHMHHWADGGETALDNLVTLCRRHHRLVHEAGFSVYRRDGKIEFATPAGAPLPPCGCDARFRGSVDELTAGNPAGDDIGPGSLIPEWYGDPLDLAYVTAVLLQEPGRPAIDPVADCQPCKSATDVRACETAT